MDGLFSWMAGCGGALGVGMILGTTLVEPGGSPDSIAVSLKWALAHGAVPLLFSGAWMIYGFVALRLPGGVLMLLGGIATLWGSGIAMAPKGLALGVAAMAVGNGLMMAGDLVRRRGLT
jgi:hypothetical protein